MIALQAEVGESRLAASGHPSSFPVFLRQGDWFAVDAVDYAIYRYLSPDGLIRFWGTRRLVDPRASAREMAKQVGLSEAGVRVRLRALEAQGYLRGRETGLNPSLFGVSLAVSEIPVREPEQAQRLLSDLALVEGVTFARDILDETDRKIRVFYITDTPAATNRRTALLRKLAPTPQFRGPIPYWIPPCEKELSRLDWKLLRAFRKLPEASIGELAEEVHVSVKTAASRLHQLLDARAAWSALDSSCEELPLSMLTLSVRPEADPAAVAQEVQQAHPTWMPVAPDGLGVPPAKIPHAVVGLLPAEAPAALERAVRRTLSIDGVSGVHRTFALGSANFPQWLDDRLEAKIRESG